MKKFLHALHIGLLAVTLSGCNRLISLSIISRVFLTRKPENSFSNLAPPKPVTNGNTDAEPIVTWDTNYSVFISPPPEVKQEIARRCADANHDIGMVTVIDLSGKEVTARYRCRGAL